jgi:hypothetical protein
MVGTVGAARRLGGTWSLARTAAAYAAGLAAGSLVVFGGLGVAAAAVDPGRTSLLAAAGLAAVAAAADALGLRVRPQIRFQVPERWRRTLPLPLAVFLYGTLLGTGLTTFVPAAAAWALFGFALSIGSLATALLVGACLAAGRALPVVLLAPLVDAGIGARALAVITERPASLRIVRGLAAVSLAAGAAAVFAGAASAATVVAVPAGDPSAVDADVAWEQPGVGGFLRTATGTVQLPGHDPAIGGALVAWRVGDTVTVATRATLAPVLQETIVGARRLAVSDRWLAFTTVDADGTTRLTVQSLADTNRTETLASTAAPAQVGRPSLDGDRLVFHVATRRASWITLVDLVGGKRARLRSATNAQLVNPAVAGDSLLYVRAGRCAQELRLGGLAGGSSDRVLLTLPPLAGSDLGHEPRHPRQGTHVPCKVRPRPAARMLWTTALAPGAAYVTTLRPQAGGRTTPTLLQIPR